MALGYLGLLFMVLIVVSLTFQILLYKDKSGNNNLIFLLNMLLGILLSFLAFTSLPSNFIGQKILSVAWGIIAILGMVVKAKGEEGLVTSKIMLTAAIVGGLIHLLL